MERTTPHFTDGLPTTPEPSPALRARGIVRKALGGFWILDGLLQLQPRMFQVAMIHNVMEPLVVGEPTWLANTVSWAIHIMTPDVTAWDVLIVVVQLVLGVVILFGRTPRLIRTGLWLSLFWTAAVWLFGEGLGGVLTGSATVVTGEPGPVVLYGWIAVTLLLGDRFWEFGHGFNLVRDVPAVFFGLAALQQMAPIFWSSMGLSSQFQSTWSMEPRYMQHTMLWTVTVSYDHPVIVNLILILALAFVSWRLFSERPGLTAYVMAGVLMFVLWWCGQGFGALFTGMSTDLNSMPLLALMMLPGWLSARQDSVPDRKKMVRTAVEHSSFAL